MNALMKSPTTLLLWILMTVLQTVLLSACGSDDDETQAERAGIGAIAQAAGTTPFVAQLSYSLDNFAHLDSVHYAIAGRPGSYSLPVGVTYDRAWLGRRAAWDASAKRIAFPVFGLYANHGNAITLTTYFRDGSTHVAQVTVATGPYTGPATVYSAPEVRKARGAASPGVEYMLIKNGLTAPVILDSDGQMRWAGSTPGDSFSSLLGADAFYVGDQDAPLLHQVDVDGSVRSSRPSRIRPIVVATSRARNRSWVAISTAAPASRWRCKRRWNSALACGSRPDVGSSSSRARAVRAIDSAIATFWRIPFE